ncbi:MAG: DNA methyltransferase, partial [Nitrospirae bacterium]|nr:DNA methyltransferase [Nitrospirota bacterium]
QAYDLKGIDITEKRKKVRYDHEWNKKFVQCVWRPLDIRFLYYNTELIDRPCRQITEPLLQSNLALLAMRQIALHNGCSHFLAVNYPVIDRIFYSNKGAASVFPLYLYSDIDTKKSQQSLLNLNASQESRHANLSPTFIDDTAKRLTLRFIPDGTGDLKKTFGPEDMFYYTYAVFHSPTYRTRYAEFLKIDFPRLPLTSDLALFKTLTP